MPNSQLENQLLPWVNSQQSRLSLLDESRITISGSEWRRSCFQVNKHEFPWRRSLRFSLGSGLTRRKWTLRKGPGIGWFPSSVKAVSVPKEAQLIPEHPLLLLHLDKLLLQELGLEHKLTRQDTATLPRVFSYSIHTKKADQLILTAIAFPVPSFHPRIPSQGKECGIWRIIELDPIDTLLFQTKIYACPRATFFQPNPVLNFPKHNQGMLIYLM